MSSLHFTVIVMDFRLQHCIPVMMLNYAKSSMQPQVHPCSLYFIFYAIQKTFYMIQQQIMQGIPAVAVQQHT